MKSPHELLLESTTARLRAEEEEKKWSAIVRACRTPIWPAAFQLVVCPLIIGAFFVIGRTGGLRPIYAIPFLFLFIALGQLLAASKKREQGLLAAIQRAAPELYDKLQHEKVA